MVTEVVQLAPEGVVVWCGVVKEVRLKMKADRLEESKKMVDEGFRSLFGEDVVVAIK